MCFCFVLFYELEFSFLLIRMINNSKWSRKFACEVYPLKLIVICSAKSTFSDLDDAMEENMMSKHATVNQFT